MPKRRANGEGNIRKRKDGRWEGRYTVGHDPETGKAIIKNVLGKTQAEVHYQIFCGIMIPPSLPITNFKIVSAIRNEIASRLDIDSFQEILASHWKPYLDNLHVCMTDATCVFLWT